MKECNSTELETFLKKKQKKTNHNVDNVFKEKAKKNKP
jgi:hypothetical protein